MRGWHETTDNKRISERRLERKRWKKRNDAVNVVLKGKLDGEEVHAINHLAVLFDYAFLPGPGWERYDQEEEEEEDLGWLATMAQVERKVGVEKEWRERGSLASGI